MPSRHHSTSAPPHSPFEPQPALWFIFCGDQLLLRGRAEQLQVPCSPWPPVDAETTVYQREIDSHAGVPCLVVELREIPVDQGFAAVSLREAHGHLGEELWAIAGRASQVLRWRRDHRFCGRCGQEMVEEPRELLRRCPHCGFFSYPRISPAVIMSVVHGDRILLGRAPRFPPGMYSVLAGFVEPGESLEQAVAREVREEVNLEVDDIRYAGSQPWPFPHSLMVGFTARYAGGTIAIDTRELEDAGWFSPDDMPRLPSTLSIARRLIDRFLADHEKSAG